MFILQAVALIVLLGVAFAEPWGRGGWGGRGGRGGWGGGGGWGGRGGWGRKRRSAETEMIDEDAFQDEQLNKDGVSVVDPSNGLSKRSAEPWGGWGGRGGGGRGWGGRGGYGRGWGK